MTTPVDIDELVADTLDWVTYGEPNPTDLVDLTTRHFPIAAHDIGFRGDENIVIGLAEFRRDGDGDGEPDDTALLVELVTTVDGVERHPDVLRLTYDHDTITYPTHEEGLRAFYQWCATGDITPPSASAH